MLRISLCVLCVAAISIFQPSANSSFVTELKNEDELFSLVGGVCYVTVDNPCNIPNGTVCADGLKLCVNNACPTVVGYRLNMDSYRRSETAAAGRESRNQDYEPLACLRKHICGCRQIMVGNLLYNVCADDSNPDYADYVTESYATGGACPSGS